MAAMMPPISKANPPRRPATRSTPTGKGMGMMGLANTAASVPSPTGRWVGVRGGKTPAIRQGGGIPAPSDTVPAMLTPGETVIPKELSEQSLAPLIAIYQKNGEVTDQDIENYLYPILQNLQPQGFNCGGKVGFDKGGLVQRIKDYFTDPNVLQTRREVEQMQAGTYQGQPEIAQPNPTPAMPPAGNTPPADAVERGIDALALRKSRIDDAVNKAQGFAKGGNVLGFWEAGQVPEDEDQMGYYAGLNSSMPEGSPLRKPDPKPRVPSYAEMNRQMSTGTAMATGGMGFNPRGYDQISDYARNNSSLPEGSWLRGLPQGSNMPSVSDINRQMSTGTAFNKALTANNANSVAMPDPADNGDSTIAQAYSRDFSVPANPPTFQGNPNPDYVSPKAMLKAQRRYVAQDKDASMFDVLNPVNALYDPNIPMPPSNLPSIANPATSNKPGINQSTLSQAMVGNPLFVNKKRPPEQPKPVTNAVVKQPNQPPVSTPVVSSPTKPAEQPKPNANQPVAQKSQQNPSTPAMPPPGAPVQNSIASGSRTLFNNMNDLTDTSTTTSNLSYGMGENGNVTKTVNGKPAAMGGNVSFLPAGYGTMIGDNRSSPERAMDFVNNMKGDTFLGTEQAPTAAMKLAAYNALTGQGGTPTGPTIRTNVYGEQVGGVDQALREFHDRNLTGKMTPQGAQGLQALLKLKNEQLGAQNQGMTHQALAQERLDNQQARIQALAMQYAPQQIQAEYAKRYKMAKDDNERKAIMAEWEAIRNIIGKQEQSKADGTPYQLYNTETIDKETGNVVKTPAGAFNTATGQRVPFEPVNMPGRQAPPEAIAHLLELVKDPNQKQEAIAYFQSHGWSLPPGVQ